MKTMRKLKKKAEKQLKIIEHHKPHIQFKLKF